MEMTGVDYPFSLGSKGKNKLTKQGGTCKRWINVNHVNWQKPSWKLKECQVFLIDRSLGDKKFTYFTSDIGAMTEDYDPLLNMKMYDLVPCKSPVFDIDSKPTEDIEKLYEWSRIQPIARPIDNNPLENTPMIPYASYLLVPFLYFYLIKEKDNL